MSHDVIAVDPESHRLGIVKTAETAKPTTAASAGARSARAADGRSWWRSHAYTATRNAARGKPISRVRLCVPATNIVPIATNAIGRVADPASRRSAIARAVLPTTSVSIETATNSAQAPRVYTLATY